MMRTRTAGVSDITSPYFVLPSQANDLYFAVEAAQQAWSGLLSKQFVVAGQSQGLFISVQPWRLLNRH
jgi:hypothetical protein